MIYTDDDQHGHIDADYDRWYASLHHEDDHFDIALAQFILHHSYQK